MKKNKKQVVVVNVSEVKTRSGWNGIKPTPAFRPRKLYTAVRAAGRRCSHERL